MTGDRQRNRTLGKPEAGSRRVNISEDNFVSWSKGPGQTEADKCSNAERAVRKAIKASEQLAALDVSVFAQGSYSARTNVRQNSDVDVCVRYNATFFDLLSRRHVSRNRRERSGHDGVR